MEAQHADEEKDASVAPTLAEDDKDGPSDHELEELRKTADRLPAMAIVVIVVSLFERYAYYGFLGILRESKLGASNHPNHPEQITDIFAENYIQNSYDDPLRPGALGLGQNLASLMINCFTLVAYISPLGAAVVADSYIGRYKALVISLSLYTIGLVVLLITSIPMLSQRGAGLPGLIVAMVWISLGLGGIKSTLPPFLGKTPETLRRSKVANNYKPISAIVPLVSRL